MKSVLQRKSRTRRLFRLTSEYSHPPPPVAVHRIFRVPAHHPGVSLPASASRMARMMWGAHRMLSRAMALVARSTASRPSPEAACADHCLAHSNQLH